MSTFTGFGFGPIQAGLFLYEACLSGAFDRLVVAEIDAGVVAALRAAGGTYAVNVAHADGLETVFVNGVEIFNPAVASDREALADAVAASSELATALPDVRGYDTGDPSSPAAILAEGLRRKARAGHPPAALYAGENNMTAAAMLDAALRERGAPEGVVACVDTVIGKMSGTVTGGEAIRREGLTPFVPGAERAFRVEAFNRILIGRILWSGFRRGLASFAEQDDLSPFEEAKLFGHNAAHAVLGYGLEAEGRAWICEAREHPAALQDARGAFLEESGAALIRRHGGRDPLFTSEGFADYVEDLLTRMTNPFLHDSVARVTRNPARKLGWNDRLIGALRLALRERIRPRRLAHAARLALNRWMRESGRSFEEAGEILWPEADADERFDVLTLLRQEGANTAWVGGPGHEGGRTCIR